MRKRLRVQSKRNGFGLRGGTPTQVKRSASVCASRDSARPRRARGDRPLRHAPRLHCATRRQPTRNHPRPQETCHERFPFGWAPAGARSGCVKQSCALGNRCRGLRRRTVLLLAGGHAPRGPRPLERLLPSPLHPLHCALGPDCHPARRFFPSRFSGRRWPWLVSG